MGKKKIQTIDDSESKTKAVVEPVEIVAEEVAENTEETVKTEKKTKKAKPGRGRNYKAALKKVDRQKKYNVAEAVKLVKETSLSKFGGSVEAHLVVKETGIKGDVAFPHTTGKTAKVAVASDELLAEIEKGKIDFTVLLATPEMMPKLAKYAKVLGPKGLMPNPKAGTVTTDPDKTIKDMSGKVAYKTEAKAPLMHIVIGKVADKEEDLSANFQALIKAIGPSKIEKAVITSTMGPGIKIDTSF